MKALHRTVAAATLTAPDPATVTLSNGETYEAPVVGGAARPGTSGGGAPPHPARARE